MSHNINFKTLLFICSTLLSATQSQAQIKDYVGQKGKVYLSWGYNKEWYTRSNIHIKQESLGNDYTFESVSAKDHPGWMGDEHNLFQQPISIPQYNYRLGYWFKDNWAAEINFDHTKYIVNQGQMLHIKGTINNLPVDEQRVNNNIIKWQLNNGANFFLFNLVHRVQIPKMQFRNFNVSLLLKGGVGFMVPHVENTIMGQSNKPAFQFGGFDIGAEAALRFTFFKYAYLEYCNKALYANYFGLKVYEGKARQAFGCYEMIANIGAEFPVFSGKKSKKTYTIPDQKNDSDEKSSH